MKNPLISVIVPTFQCAKYLRRAIESVLAQTYDRRSLEIIVVDDGSTDNTADVIAPFLSAVHYIRQEHAGLSAARNAGIRASSGEYVAFLDADDYWLPRRLERMVSELQTKERTILQDDCFLERDGRRAPRPFYGKEVPAVFSSDPQAQYRQLLKAVFGLAGKIVIPRAAFSEVGFYDERLRHYEDADLVIRCCAAGYAFRILPEALEVYTIRDDSLSESPWLDILMDLLRVRLKHAAAVDAEDIKVHIGSIQYHAMQKGIRECNWFLFSRSAMGVLSNHTYVRTAAPELVRRCFGRATVHDPYAWRKAI